MPRQVRDEPERPPPGEVYPGDPFGRRACVKCDLPTEQPSAMHAWCREPAMLRRLDDAIRDLHAGKHRTRPSAGGGVPAPGATSQQGNAASPASVAPRPATKRQFRHYRTRETAWVEPPASAGELLGSLPDGVERVYMLGPRPGGGTAGGLRGWAMAALPDGWSHAPAGHYLEGEGIALKYVRPDGGRVELLRAAQWFGLDRHDYSAQQAARAWQVVERVVRAVFGSSARLLSTPATTGRDLLLRSIPDGREWPTMSDEHQQLVRATSGQGRIELLPALGAELPALYQLDGRLMYAALAWGLPAGEPRMVTTDEYLGQQRARYRVAVTVPSDWHERCICGAPGHARIGLLGAHDGADGWRWPAEPGETFTTWSDGAELWVAHQHGWHVEYGDALVWPPENVGPLDGWRDKLLNVRRTLSGAQGLVGRLAASAVRAILLHAIGAMHGAPHRSTRMAPVESPELVPADARSLRVEGDHYVWSSGDRPAWREVSHPEWSAAIWARARARLLQAPRGAGALRVPAEHVVAFRTDAIYLTSDPRWPDDGSVGNFRVKTAQRSPCAWPRTHSDLLKLRENS